MNANEFVRSTQSLGMRYLEEYTRGLQRYSDLLNNIAKPDNCHAASLGSSSDTIIEQQNRYSQFVISEAPKVVEQLSIASMNYYTLLADLGIKTMNRYIEHVVNGQTPQNAAPAAADSKPSPLVFHGVSQEQTSNAFLISNHRGAAIDVKFDVAEVVSEDGKSRFKPEVAFTPDTCKIGPRSEKVVQCTLTLSKKFKTGQRYQGAIAVVGFPEMSMPFSVDIEKSSSSTNQPAARKSPAVKKSATKKRIKTVAQRKTGNKNIGNKKITPKKTAKRKATRKKGRR